MIISKCNLIVLILIILIGIALYIFYNSQNKVSKGNNLNKERREIKKIEKFMDDFKTCTQKESKMLRHTCLENNYNPDYSLVRPQDYVDRDKVEGCQRYNSRYDFSTPSKMYIKLQ